MARTATGSNGNALGNFGARHEHTSNANSSSNQPAIQVRARSANKCAADMAQGEVDAALGEQQGGAAMSIKTFFKRLRYWLGERVGIKNALYWAWWDAKCKEQR